MTFFFFRILAYAFVAASAHLLSDLASFFGDVGLSQKGAIFLSSLGPVMIVAIADVWISRRYLAKPLTNKHSSHEAEHLKSLQPHDALTGLPSANLLYAELGKHCVDPRSFASERIALVHLAIRDFASLTRREGASAGDLLLRHLVARLSGRLRESDLLARIDRHHFAILVNDVDRAEAIEALCGRLDETCAEPFDVFGRTTYVDLSYGVHWSDRQPADVDDMMEASARALDLSLQDEAGSVRFSDENINQMLKKRREIARQLSQAIGTDDIEILFQPSFDAETKRLRTISARPSWHHGERGLLRSDVVWPLAADAHSSLYLWRTTLRHACKALADWRGRGAKTLKLNLDLPAAALADDRLIDEIETMLKAYGLPASHLILGLDEATAATLRGAQRSKLALLKQGGLGLALQGFGSTDASLRRLKDMDIDQLRFNLEDISRDGADPQGWTIFAAAAALGLYSGQDVVAEGIEDAERSREAIELGCSSMQGGYFSPEASLMEINAIVDALVALAGDEKDQAVQPLASSLAS